jgi:hypothetical protein
MREMATFKPALGRLSEDVAVAARFLRGLPGFLRNPLMLEEARAVLAERMRSRERRFLALVGASIDGRPDSVYARLLEFAGCELGDVERIVADHGVEGALQRLVQEGVYLTVDEFKGRRPAVRGSQTFEVRMDDLRNPGAVVHGLAQSGGSRGAPTVVPIDLAFVRDHAVNTHLTLDAHGGAGWVHAHWGVPGGTAVTNLLEFAKGGNPAMRWFTPVAANAPGIHPRYRVGSSALRLVAKAAGVPIPRPEFVPLDDPRPIARWMSDTLRSGRTPHLWTFASSAVLVAGAARAEGIDIAGARFTGGGEPTTPARRAAVERVGAQLLPRFGTTETDIFAYACAAPSAADDMHLLDDRHAVIQAEGASLPPGAMFVSSLLHSTPLLLLNVSLGDRATLARRECGCPLEELGWAMHISDARSFEKLTAGGITFLDVDVVRILEEVLPARFGGGPTDYQLVETEDGDGRPVVRLLVHPEVGELDDQVVTDAFLDAVGGGSEGERLAELQWRARGVLTVERGAPERTASGKIQHLHVRR